MLEFPRELVLLVFFLSVCNCVKCFHIYIWVQIPVSFKVWFIGQPVSGTLAEDEVGMYRVGGKNVEVQIPRPHPQLLNQGETGNLHFKFILQVITMLTKSLEPLIWFCHINKGSPTSPSADLLKPLPIFSKC